MPISKQHLDRLKIDDAILTFDKDFTIEKVQKPNFISYVIKKNGAQSSKLNIYGNTDGTTSISWSECQNKEFSEKLANFVHEHCKYPTFNKGKIYIKDFSEDSLNSLLEFLVDFCNAKIENTKNISKGKQYILRSQFGDKVYLNHFQNNSFNVQGSYGLMKSQVLEGLSCYLTYKDIVDATLTTYNVTDLDISEIETLFEARFPESHKVMHETLRTIILPVFLTQRMVFDESIPMDYSFMVFPILRGLEGCLRQLFADVGITCKTNIGTEFVENSNGTAFVLSNTNNKKISDALRIEVLESFYNYHKNNRHAIFHVDNTLITTRIITSREDAISIINEVAELIEKGFTKLNSVANKHSA